MKFKPIVPETVFGPDQKRMHDLANDLEALYGENNKLAEVTNPNELQRARLLETQSEITAKEKNFNHLLPKDFHHQSYKIKI